MDEAKLDRIRQVEEAYPCDWRIKRPGGEWMLLTEYLAQLRAEMEAAEAIKH